MPELYLSALPERGVLTIVGPDSRAFLQGLISNDITRVTKERSIYAALLSPQGKYLFDFFISQSADTLLFDCEKSRLTDLSKRLRMYKLRADAVVTDETERYGVSALWGADLSSISGLKAQAGNAREFAGGSLCFDPRLKEAGLRAVVPTDQRETALSPLGAQQSTAAAYDIHRLKLGLPDASRDFVVEKSILLESGFDDLNGIDWEKGCYMGQELTARTKYRGLIKKRLTAVTIDGKAPEPGEPILSGTKIAGEMRSSNGEYGMALLRLDYLKDPAPDLRTDNAILRARKPEWAQF